MSASKAPMWSVRTDTGSGDASIAYQVAGEGGTRAEGDDELTSVHY